MAKKHRAMTPAQFRRWRKSLGWTQQVAADELDIHQRTVCNYECGGTKNKPTPIPHTTKLATKELTREFAAA